MTIDQIKELNGVEIPEGKIYSSVLLSAPKNTFSLKSKSGNEFIFIAENDTEGEVFYHSDCKPTNVAREILLGHNENGPVTRRINEPIGKPVFFVKQAPQDFEEFKELLNT